VSIASRLKRLELEKPELVADPASHAKLMELLRSNYERSAGSDLSEAWLVKQSNMTEQWQCTATYPCLSA
jgi:hypothetical protein